MSMWNFELNFIMFPTSRDYEQLERQLPISDRNVNTPLSYRTHTPSMLFSPNISRSSTDTSLESHTGRFISNSNVNNNRNKFRQYRLFEDTSADTSMLINTNASCDTPTFTKFEKPVSSMKTSFKDRQRPILGRKDFPITPENQQLEGNPFCENTGWVNGFASGPFATTNSRNASPEEWQLSMGRHKENSSISPIESIMNPFSAEFIPKKSPSGLFKPSNSPMNSKVYSSFNKCAPRVSPTTNPFYIENLDQEMDLFSGILNETSISQINRNNPVSIEYMTNPYNFGTVCQEAASSFGILSDTSISPISRINSGSVQSTQKVSPTSNQFPYEMLDLKTESSFGKFSEPSISPINNLNPGSIGYLPMVSPITNPINFDNLNHGAESSMGIGGNRICKFCKKNGERPKVYTTHTLKIKIGNKYVVACPVLRSYVCSICSGTGDDAHTITYCPKMVESNTKRPKSTTITLKTTRVKSNGQKRFK